MKKIKLEKSKEKNKNLTLLSHKNPTLSQDPILKIINQ